MPIKHYVNFLPAQKLFFKPKQTFHRRANYMFLTQSQKQCVKKIQEMINLSKTTRMSFHISGYPGCGE